MKWSMFFIFPNQKIEMPTDNLDNLSIPCVGTQNFPSVADYFLQYCKFLNPQNVL